jgi:hypothetical protein
LPLAASVLTEDNRVVGLLWRLLVPRKVKKVRRILSPTQLIADVIQPKPLKQARRIAYRSMNPVRGVEGLAGDALMGAKPTKKRSIPKKAPPQRPDGLPHRFTDAWIKKNVPRMSPSHVQYVIRDMRKRGWSDAEIARRVYPYVKR